MEEHQCNQQATLATICEQLKGIENDIKEIKDGQLMFVEGLREREVNAAKYPTPEEVREADRKLRLHDTYFKIIWVALGGAWSVLLVILGAWVSGTLHP